MGFDVQEISTISGLFDSIGFREIEFVVSMEPITSFSLILEPVLRNAVIISEFWKQNPGFRWLWYCKGRYLNIKINEHGDCIIGVVDSEEDFKATMLENFNKLDDEARLTIIRTELMNIWNELRISNWLPKLCETNVSVPRPANRNINIVTIGPFDLTNVYELGWEDIVSDDRTQICTGNGTIFFSNPVTARNPRTVPLAINTGSIDATAIISYDSRSVLYNFLDINSVILSVPKKEQPGTFVIRTTLDEGLEEAVIRLDSATWSISFETDRIVCKYIKHEMSSAIIIRKESVVDVSWEPTSIATK